MKKLFFFVLILGLNPFFFAQKRARKTSIDFTTFIGGSYYIGDLNPVQHFNSFTKPAIGMGLRFNRNTRISMQANILYGSIAGDDKQSPSLGLRARNLNFKSIVNEYSFRWEFNFVDYKMNALDKFFSPYTFLGIACFRFNPKGEYNNAWRTLRPLATEGQGTAANPGSKRYKLLQVSIPFGLGFKLNLSEKMDVAMEWGMRKTFTDYLDDVSTVYPDPVVLGTEKGLLSVSYSDRSDNTNNVGRQRGNSKNKDWYSFGGIVIGFKFKEPDQPCPAFE